MGRRPRIDPDGGWYHVMNRGADHQSVFTTRGDGELFESLLGDACDRHGVEVHAYCLMSNHFHLLVHCPYGGLPPFMHVVTSTYSKRYNLRVGRDGPLFRARYLALPIGSPECRVTVGRYIHRNPLDAAAVVSMVELFIDEQLPDTGGTERRGLLRAATTALLDQADAPLRHELASVLDFPTVAARSVARRRAAERIAADPRLAAVVERALRLTA